METRERLTVVRTAIAIAGVVAGLLAFGLGEAVYGLIPAETSKIQTLGNVVTAQTGQTLEVAAVRNAALAFGVLGLCLGGTFGLAGGMIGRRPTIATLGAFGLGAIVGALAAAGVSLALVRQALQTAERYPEYELPIAIVMHAAIWGVAGAVAGLAFAVGRGVPRYWPRALAAGFAGGLLGAIAFDLIGAAIFPLANTGEALSTTWPSRLLARMLVGLGTAGALIFGVSRTSAPKTSTA